MLTLCAWVARLMLKIRAYIYPTLGSHTSLWAPWNVSSNVGSPANEIIDPNSFMLPVVTQSNVPTLVPCLPDVPKTKEFVPFVSVMVLEAGASFIEMKPSKLLSSWRDIRFEVLTTLAVISVVQRCKGNFNRVIRTLIKFSLLGRHTNSPLLNTLYRDGGCSSF